MANRRARASASGPPASDDHALVEDFDQTVVTDDLDRLPREVAPHVVLEVEQAHRPVKEHAPDEALRRPGRGYRRFRLLEWYRPRCGEAIDRWSVAEALVLAEVVVSCTQASSAALSLGDRREDLAIEKLALERLVEALDLPGRRR